MSDKRLSDLLVTIYDAALDPSLWTAVLEQSSLFLNCMGGIIGAYDLTLDGQTLSATWGFAPEYLATLPEYMKIHPLVPMSFRLKEGEFGSVIDGMPHEDFYKHPGYIGWAKPQGIVDLIQATLERTPLALSGFAFSRHRKQGIVDDELRQRLRLLVPHVQRAFMIGKTIDLTRLETAALGETIDGLSAAVFLLDADTGLLHANRAAEAMLAGGELFSVADRKLVARSADADAALRQSVSSAALGDAAMADRGVAVPLKGNSGGQYAAYVLPLKSGRRAAGGLGQSAAAAMFIRRVALDFPQPVATVAERYNLTAGETRTLTALVGLDGIPAAAMMLGVSEATVKTNLQRIFSKTGAARQSDLVKLVAGHASPLGSA